MTRYYALIGMLLLMLTAQVAQAEGTIHRLYEGMTLFINNADGKEFTLTLDVRDINHSGRGPNELLLKVYPPDGKPVVREVIPDDGVNANTFGTIAAGWDHEAWYYASSYSRGIEPAVRWSAFSHPSRLLAMPKRTFTYAIAGGQKGVYRVVMAGSPDHYVGISLSPALSYGVAGSPEWIHGSGARYKRSYLYVPKGALGLALALVENDMPYGRVVRISAPDGSTVLSSGPALGFAQTSVTFDPPGKYDDQVLTVEVSDAPGDYLMNLSVLMPKEERNVRGRPEAPAVLAPDAQTATAVKNGAIYHDGQLFWQMYQVRMYEWLKTMKPEDYAIPKDLPAQPGFISVGSHNSPKAGSADRLMHDYQAHKNRQALNAALRDMLEGMRLIGATDHVIHGRNLAYEMGCYSFFYHRPAWRILQQSDAPEEVKSLLREFIIQIGDRLAFCRGIELVNGNSLASAVAALRYCVAASQDPLQTQLFDTYFERVTTGGFGDRIGMGPSGGMQESFGYDYHYGTYILRGWRAVNADLADPRIQEAYDRVMTLYSYTYMPESSAAIWSSRTALGLAAYDAWGPFMFKGFGGPDFTLSVNDGNEWFAARRANYYAVTYHGRINPSWIGEGFHGQIGFSGGAISVLYIPNKGTVLASTLNGGYGAGMHPSNWRNFHIHSVVGMTADGKPLITANSEHRNARLEGTTVTSSNEVRESSVHATRTYTFGAEDITCSVQLRGSSADRVFRIYGGAHGLRGVVTEAYEMVPFIPFKPKKERSKNPEDQTAVYALGVDGAPLGSLSAQALQAKAVVIDRGGFGARLEFEKPMPVLRGNNNTVLIQLASERTPADAIALTYRIIPFVGDAAESMAPVVEQKLASVGPLDAVEKVAAALAGAQAFTVKSGQREVAEVRFALAGDRLAVHAKVTDARVALNPVPWRASAIEVFGSMVGKTAIGQVFLTPKVGTTPARGYRSNKGKIEPAPDILMSSSLTATGYELQALIPLSLLAVNPAAGKLLLETQIDAAPTAQGAYENTTLFGSARAYEMNHRFGVFQFEK